MDHLINPVAFRLDYFKSWEDTWFVKNIYYPEFLNGMLKLRNYLYYFLTNKGLLRSGIFLSNFFILKYNKLYIINIYIYHIDYEKVSYRCINNIYASLFSYNRNFKKKKINNFYNLFMSNIDLYVFLLYFYKLIYKKKKNNKNQYNFNLFINSNLFYKSNYFISYFKTFLFKYNNKLISKLLNKEEDTQLNNLYERNYWSNIYLKFYNKKKFKDFFTIYKKYKLYDNDSNFFLKKFTLLEFIMYLLKKINYNYYDKSFNKIIKLNSLISILRIFKYLNIKINRNYNFLLFYFVILLKSMIYNIKKNKFYRIRNKIYFFLYESLGYKFFFKQLKIIKNFLNNIFFIINKVKNICYKFYFLSNKNITARWLSRYIGLKLKNNYSFYSVLNPIKRELYKLCKLRHNKKNKFNSINKLRNLINKNNKKYKYKFKNLIKNFSLLYVKENYMYYIVNNHYMYDWFIYFYNKNLFQNTIKEYTNLYKYLYINIFTNYYWELNLIKKQKIVDNIVNRVNNFSIINLVYKLNFNLKKIYISAFFIKNLINFNYLKYIWLELKKFNARNLRNKIIRRHKSILLGYKLAFKGRFSRKQRVSNIWLMHGKVALNTLSIKLDYSFFTIALKNSAISIKIILYKSLYKEYFKYLLIY